MEREAFVKRFIEVCGTSQPARIAQLLNISYQAAKNYLDGRLPDSKVLKTIAEKTPFSINWLLTGIGDKFVKDASTSDLSVPSGQMRDFVRRICIEVVGETFGAQSDTATPKVIALTPDMIKQEKVLAEPVSIPENRQDVD